MDRLVHAGGVGLWDDRVNNSIHQTDLNARWGRRNSLAVLRQISRSSRWTTIQFLRCFVDCRRLVLGIHVAEIPGWRAFDERCPPSKKAIAGFGFLALAI